MRLRDQCCAVLLVLAAGLLSSPSALAGEAPAAVSAAQAGGVLAECDGRLREVLLQYVPSFAEELEPTYDDLFDVLPSDVHVQVLCPTREAACEFDERWGGAERGKGRCISVINVDRPITVWARDRRIARVDHHIGAATPAIVPRASDDYDEEYRNDLLVSYLLEYAGTWPRAEDTFLHIEGGNIVANRRHVFVGANVIEKNEALGSDAAVVGRELVRLLGRPYVLVGDRNHRTPLSHVDMYLTPVDDQTVLVASPSVAESLLASEGLGTDEATAVAFEDDCQVSLASRGWRFDAVAAQVADYGYSVVRLPTLVDSADEWAVTYNNVLMEERDGQRIVYMPVYGLPALDAVADAVYQGLGFEVRTIDVSRIFQHGGAVRCLVNVLSREGADVVLSGEGLDTTANAASILEDTTPTSAEGLNVVGSPPVSATANTAGPRTSSAMWFPVSGIWLPLFIFFARVLDVSIGTVRVICITRGRKTLAISLALVEVTIWLLAVASVIMHLNNWLNILAYVGGFTVGNALGMWIEQRLALGVETVILISQQKGKHIAAALREADLRPTTFTGSGRDGPVEMCLAFVPRRLTSLVLSLSRAIDPDVIVTVEDVRHTSIKWSGSGATGRVRPANNGRGHLWRRGALEAVESPAVAEEAA